MKMPFAVLLMIAATVSVPAAQQGAAAQPNQQQPSPPAMSEDKRVKTDDIDVVVAAKDAVVLDVRELKEIEELGGYTGAINIPLPQLEKRLGELPRDKTILTA